MRFEAKFLFIPRGLLMWSSLTNEMISSMQMSLLERLWVVKTNHIWREANGCAELLAKKGTDQSEREIFYDTCYFEGDSATVLNCIQAGSPCLAPFGNVIEDSISLASRLGYYSFSHVRRKGNVVADKLAKLAKYLDVPKDWLEDIPSDVNSLVLIESSFAEV
ncbi:hypothetical protein SO802_022018 [Lithocarpus litseifolius]|uniref:HTH cro/C1-type domain-containing protein n=1 Tax=Lithocarpus litseifolius TaxID=425828 RepID=A0AAW2CGQ6_9ROSI